MQPTSALILEKIYRPGKGLIGMKLIGEGKFRRSRRKRDNSIRYVLSLRSVDAMVVGFEKLSEIDGFAASNNSATQNGIPSAPNCKLISHPELNTPVTL